MSDAAPLLPLTALAKFTDPLKTLDGSERATVEMKQLTTLWFNTGTLCNLECVNCYIESSPQNDRLVYLTLDDVIPYLEEIVRDCLPVTEIGLTGGEPFMAPDIMDILEAVLVRGFRVLVLTNAMRPMMKRQRELLALKEEHGDRLVLRVSVDHYSQVAHETLRGSRTWEPTIRGIRWLADNGFAINLASRTCWSETESELRSGFATLSSRENWMVDTSDASEMVLFPEMDSTVDVPEITAACWDILGKRPQDVMCASSRMVVKRKGAERPAVVACTLLPYDPRFELGETLAEASVPVPLNHPHCAKFCVLGGGSCSKTA